MGASERKRRCTRLLGTEHSVSGIAQARHDIAVIIQLLVDGSSPDWNVGMFLLKLRNPLGSCEQADKPDISGASRFEQIDRGAS